MYIYTCSAYIHTYARTNTYMVHTNTYLLIHTLHCVTLHHITHNIGSWPQPPRIDWANASRGAFPAPLGIGSTTSVSTNGGTWGLVVVKNDGAKMYRIYVHLYIYISLCMCVYVYIYIYTVIYNVHTHTFYHLKKCLHAGLTFTSWKRRSRTATEMDIELMIGEKMSPEIL